MGKKDVYYLRYEMLSGGQLWERRRRGTAEFHGAVGRRHVNLHRKYEVQQENMRFSMVNETILAIIIALAISAALCPVIIPFLHRLKFGQQVRDDGPRAI